jgi:hypothetical protein
LKKGGGEPPAVPAAILRKKQPWPLVKSGKKVYTELAFVHEILWNNPHHHNI